jgi:hypothetical protein
MSIVLELINNLLQANDVVTCESTGGVCPATAFNAVAAAFATQGYFMQAEMLHALLGTDFSVWAPFIYLIAAAGGIISLALGAPPKMYLWFFIGPGIYDWLVQTRAPTHGVQWQVAQVPQDQRAVWRLAHVGLLNSPLVDRLESEGPDTRYEQSSNVKQAKWCERPAEPVYVSNFFLWFDDIVSYSVQRFVTLTGISKTSFEGSQDKMGVLPLPGNNSDTNNWYLVADKKWVILDSITSARISNAGLRDAFHSFLSSECGDELSKAIDHTNFISASKSSAQLPCSVMRHTFVDEIRRTKEPCTNSAAPYYQDSYVLVWDALRQKTVPVAEGSRRLFQDDSVGSFIHFLNGIGDNTGTALKAFYQNQTEQECHQSFFTIIQAFRWEAAQILHQMKYSGPLGMNADTLLYNLFYGWSVRTEVGGALVEKNELEQWTTDLIFVHLLRNELAVAPRVADKKYTNELNLQTYSQNFVAQTGAKTKYGEVYSWARMVPYLQGVMLYLLALAYPFACVMIVMPGYHKLLFTWMSFWVWVKIWDVGFAIVTVLERSLWAMLGSSTKMNFVSPLVYQMKDWGKIEYTPWCPVGGKPGGGLADKECFADMAKSLSCNVIPDIKASDAAGSLWWHMAALFDRALLLGSNLDLDVANGYYIYLMSALYFAVPAATGQLVLGAKAGVAGMVNGLIQGVQQDGGRGTSSGFLGNFRGQTAAGAAATRQEAHAKGMREGGFADKAFNTANQSLAQGLESGGKDALSRQFGVAGQQASLAGQQVDKRNAARGSAWRAGQGINSALSADVGATLGHFDNAHSNYSAGGQAAAIARIGESDRVPDLSGAAPAAGNNPAASGASSGPQASGVSLGGAVKTLGGALNPLTQGLNIAAGDPVQAFGPRTMAHSGLVQSGSDMVGLDIARGFGNVQAGLNDMSSSNNIAGFAASSQREALGVGERRYSAAADFGAQNSVFQASVGLSDHSAGYIGSLGGDASVVAPTSKPTDMTGLAMAGRMGMATQSSANWATSSNGFFSAHSQAVSGLSQFGAAWTSGHYSQPLNNPDNSINAMTDRGNYWSNRILDGVQRKKDE